MCRINYLRLEPQIEYRLGSNLSLLLIHHLSSCFCAFSTHVQGTEKRVECPSLCWQCLLGLDQLGQWLRSAKATLLRGFTLSFIALHTGGQHLVDSRLILPPIMANQQLWAFNLALIIHISFVFTLVHIHNILPLDREAKFTSPQLLTCQDKRITMVNYTYHWTQLL